ncbi:hypothetical protein WKW80_05710 [Variovorax humicola]|uniref:Uncharacterized protein n=1 Tax=Variovorax humicola TaxID=1769758 RepID=A0ABU8VUV5_9BURK
MDKETRKRLREEDQQALKRQREELVARRSKPWPDNVMAEASLISLGGSDQYGMLPWRGEYGELEWDKEKEGLAILYARQDVATVLCLQAPMLKAIGQVRTSIYFCAVLLLYIAYRVT